MTYPPQPPNNDPYGNPPPQPYGAPQPPYGDAQQQPYGAPQPPPYGAPQPPYGAPAYGPPPGYGAAPGVGFASWIQRVGAAVIDGLVLLPFYIVALVVGHGTDAQTGLPTINALFYIVYLLGIAVWGYNRWFVGGKSGQSWGKRVLNIRLVSEQTGQPIGAGLAFGRDLAHFVDGIICYVGYLWPLWDAKKQTLSDKICGTIVIH